MSYISINTYRIKKDFWDKYLYIKQRCSIKYWIAKNQIKNLNFEPLQGYKWNHSLFKSNENAESYEDIKLWGVYKWIKENALRHEYISTTSWSDAKKKRESKVILEFLNKEMEELLIGNSSIRTKAFFSNNIDKL